MSSPSFLQVRRYHRQSHETGAAHRHHGPPGCRTRSVRQASRRDRSGPLPPRPACVSCGPLPGRQGQRRSPRQLPRPRPESGFPPTGTTSCLSPAYGGTHQRWQGLTPFSRRRSSPEGMPPRHTPDRGHRPREAAGPTWLTKITGAPAHPRPAGNTWKKALPLFSAPPPGARDLGLADAA